MPLAPPSTRRRIYQRQTTLTDEAAEARTWVGVYARALGLPVSSGTVTAALVWYCAHLRKRLCRAGKDPAEVRRAYWATAKVKAGKVAAPMPDLEAESGGRVNDAGAA